MATSGAGYDFGGEAQGALDNSSAYQDEQLDGPGYPDGGKPDWSDLPEELGGGEPSEEELGAEVENLWAASFTDPEAAQDLSELVNTVADEYGIDPNAIYDYMEGEFSVPYGGELEEPQSGLTDDDRDTLDWLQQQREDEAYDSNLQEEFEQSRSLLPGNWTFETFKRMVSPHVALDPEGDITRAVDRMLAERDVHTGQELPEVEPLRVSTEGTNLRKGTVHPTDAKDGLGMAIKEFARGIGATQPR